MSPNTTLYVVKERGRTELNYVWSTNPKSAVEDHYLMNAIHLSGSLVADDPPITFRVDYADDYCIFVEVIEYTREPRDDRLFYSDTDRLTTLFEESTDFTETDWNRWCES